MSDLRAKVAYLQGLASGLDFSAESKEGRLLHGIIDVLTDFAEEVSELADQHEQLEDYVETLDEDLYELEDEVYCDDQLHYCDEDDDALMLDDDDDFVEVDCPGCGETVMFNSDILEDDDVIEVICPNCDEIVFINDEQPLEATHTNDITNNSDDEEEDL